MISNFRRSGNRKVSWAVAIGRNEICENTPGRSPRLAPRGIPAVNRLGGGGRSPAPAEEAQEVKPFSEPEAQALFSRYRESGGALEPLDALLRLLLPLIEVVVCKKLGSFPSDFDEIQSYALRKLCRGLARSYNPERGSLFNFSTKTVENALTDLLRRKIARDRFFTPLEAGMLERFGVNGVDHRHATADISYRAMRIKTTLRDPNEIEAARWLVRNLLSSGFRFYRHEAANALAVVYGLTPDRARWLYDMTMLSIRRALIGERRFRPVAPGTLCGTKAKALLKYQKRLPKEEFSRLVYLMRNIAPAVIESSSLADVLWGPVGERALFAHREALAVAAEGSGVC
jgi:hypothetical protein